MNGYKVYFKIGRLFLAKYDNPAGVLFLVGWDKAGCFKILFEFGRKK